MQTGYFGWSMRLTGELFEPFGALTHNIAVAALRELAVALVRGGVNLFWIETKSPKEEVADAVEAAKNWLVELQHHDF